MATKFRNLGCLIGNVGREPEARYTPKGTLMLTFGLAVEENVKQADGTWGKETDWFNLAVFGRTAEWMQNDLKAGTRVLIEYKLKRRKVEKDGKTTYETDIRVQNYEVLRGGKSRGENTESGDFGLPETAGESADFGDIPF